MKLKGKIVYIINVDWYFLLHWLDRAQASVHSGFEVHILTKYTHKENVKKMRGYGFFCHPISLDRKSMNPIKDCQTFHDIYNHLKAIDPDIVHCVTVKPNIYGGIAARLLGLKTILNISGLGLAFSGKTVKTFISRQIIQKLYRLAANRDSCLIIFENGDDKARFVQLGIGRPEKMVVVPGSGVDLDLFRFEPEEENAEPTILFAARMLWDKGLGDLVAAAAILRERGVSFRLDVAGILDDSSQNAIPLPRILQWHAAKQINWLGEITDMPNLLRRAHVVALPSNYGEGVPRILLEAAAVGRAIVATDVTGCRDIVKDGVNGILVEPGAPAKLADALERLLRDSQLRREYGERGRRLVEQIFDQKKVIAQKMKIYHSLVAKKTSSNGMNV